MQFAYGTTSGLPPPITNPTRIAYLCAVRTDTTVPTRTGFSGPQHRRRRRPPHLLIHLGFFRVLSTSVTFLRDQNTLPYNDSSLIVLERLVWG